jgi:hypothetical protein
MRLSKSDGDKSSTVTPPNSFAAGPLTPPFTNEKPASQVTAVLRLLRRRRDGLPIPHEPWKAIPFSIADFKELHRRLEEDKSLWGYVNDKVRCVSLSKY